MSDRRKQVRVGIFAVVTGMLVGIVLVVFGGMHFWTHRDHYLVEFDDSVMGLERGAQVYMNGIKIGTVDQIKLAPDNLSHVQIEIAVDANTPVHTDTRAFLSLAGITGLKVIDLKGGSLTSPRIEDGGTILAGQGTLDKLEKKADQLVEQTDQLMHKANEIVDGANRVMQNLNTATDPQAILAIVGSTRETSANLAATTGELKTLVAENRASLKKSIDSVAVAAQGANEAIGHVDTQVGALVVNANDLIGDLRGVIHSNENILQSAMSDLRQASRSFKDLAREVKEKPSRLLFSAAQAERKLP